MTSNFFAVTIGTGIRCAASRNLQKIAIYCEDRALRYGELATRIEKVTAAAIGSGVEADQNVTLLAPNCLEYVELVAGLSDAGLVVVTANSHLRPNALRAILEDSESRAIFVHPACEEATAMLRACARNCCANPFPHPPGWCANPC